MVPLLRIACLPAGSRSAVSDSYSFIIATGIITSRSKMGFSTRRKKSTSPTGALIKDLKERGMLDDTLIIFGGEFGRTPMSQSGTGRDHHIKTFSYMMAGGGFKRGITYGASDELGLCGGRQTR